MKPERVEKYQRRYREAVQQRLPGEEVLAVGIFYHTGSWGSAALAQVSGVAYLAARAIGKKRAGGMSQNVVLAVTPERLYAFGYTPRGTSIKVKDEEAVWERSAVEIELDRTSLTQRITIASPSEDERVQLDTSRMGGPEFNAAVYDLLSAPASP